MAQIRLIPSTYTRSSTNRVTVTNETNMYNNTDHTANYCSIRGRNSSSNGPYYAFIRGFNINGVPSDAIVSNVSVKIKCYKNSYLATGSAYRLRLASTPSSTSEINNTTMTEDIGTTAAIYTIPIGSLTWENIKSYGSDFSIEVPLMSTSNQYPYLYVYGAEIEVTYTIPVYHDVTASSNVSDVTIVPTSETVTEGDNIVFSILSQNSSSFIITDNDIDVTSQLVQIQPTGSEQFIPSGYTNLSSGITINSSYPITNAYNDTTSTSNYARLEFNTSTTGYIELLFGIEGIPLDATITSISAKARLRISSTSRMTNRICQLYSGSTAKGSNTDFSSTSSGGVVVTLTPGTWTVSELSNLRMRIGATSSSSSQSKYIYIYGADITIDYALNGEAYTYTISNISADHTILIEDTGPLYNVSASSSYSGATITPTSKQVREGRDITFTITTQNLAAIRLVDNNVDVTSSIVGSSGSYTYTIQNISGDHTLVLSEKPQYTIAVSSDYSIASLQTSAGTVYEGQSATITLTTSDLSTTDVFDNSVSIISSFTGSGTTYTYTLSNISESHILVATEKATIKLFIKTNGTYLRAKKIFKNINGVWTEINIESLTDHNVYIYGGVITTDHDEIGTVSHTGDDILIEINDNALSSGTYTLRYDDATRTPIENIDEITTFTIS